MASIVKEEWRNEVSDLELMRNDELLNTLKLAPHCVDPSPEVAAAGRGDDGAKFAATSEKIFFIRLQHLRVQIEYIERGRKRKRGIPSFLLLFVVVCGCFVNVKHIYCFVAGE